MSPSPKQIAGIRLDAQRALARLHDPVLRKDILGLGYLRGLEVSPEGRLVLDLVLPTPAHPGIGELRAALEARLGRIQGLGGLEIRFGFWVMGRVGPKPRTLGQVKNLIAVSETGSGKVAAGLARALAACGPTVELRSGRTCACSPWRRSATTPSTSASRTGTTPDLRLPVPARALRVRGVRATNTGTVYLIRTN